MVYYPYFDYLRIILASVVMFYHDKVIPWAFAGTFAVEVFFALSGWLIGGLLLGLKTNDLPRFYFNRAIRIWVPYYVALLFIVVLGVFRDSVSLKWIEFVIYKLTFVYNLFGTSQLADFVDQMPLKGTGNHFWSVNAEEQFYLFAPLLLVCLAGSLGRSIVLWTVIAGASWYYGVYPSIVFGVWAAVLIHSFGCLHELMWVRVLLMFVCVVSGVLLFSDGWFAKAIPFFSISVVALLAVKGVASDFGRFVGGISYPLYLNHWIGVYVGNYAFSPFGLSRSLKFPLTPPAIEL